MSNSANKKGQVVMLDTSFLIRLLNEKDPLHKSAMEYYQYLLEQEYVLYVSTIALAEYCVKGQLDEIPFETLRDDGGKTGERKRPGAETRDGITYFFRR